MLSIHWKPFTLIPDSLSVLLLHQHQNFPIGDQTYAKSVICYKKQAHYNNNTHIHEII